MVSARQVREAGGRLVQDNKKQMTIDKGGKEMSSWGKSLTAMVSITILGLAACIFEIDLQTMLLFSIAYDLTYLRINKNDEEKK